MKYTGGYDYWTTESEEHRKQREIRSLELQIVYRERELSRLREALAIARQ